MVNEDYATWSKEDLIRRVLDLEGRGRSPNERVSAVFKLPMMQAKIVAALADGKELTKSQLFLLVYGNAENPPSTRGAINNHINRIRTRMSAFGVVVHVSEGAVRIENGAVIECAIRGEDISRFVPGGQLPIFAGRRGTKEELVLEAITKRMVDGVSCITSKEIRDETGIVGRIDLIIERLQRRGNFRIIRRPSVARRGNAWTLKVRA